MNYKYIYKCRVCGNKKLFKYLNLGNQPLANSFLKKNDIKKEKKFPLEVLYCRKCYLSQLSVVVNSKFIFNDYDYLSSSSRALKDHYLKLSSYLIKKFNIKKKDLLVDIGCNDGILLNKYPKKFNNLVGIEPSNASKYITDKRINLFKNFFSELVVKKIIKKFGKAKIVTITNVLAHVDNVNNLVKDVKKLLHADGIFVIEVPYLFDMLNKGSFDVIYHEHLSYFSVYSLNKLMDKNGLKITYLKNINFGASGPAIRVFVSHKDSTYIESKNLKSKLNFEKKGGIDKKVTYARFRNSIVLIRNKLRKKIYSLVNKNNEHLACYTAPAKGNTLLNYLKIKNGILKYVSENNVKKIGKYTPGTHIKIVTDEFLIKNKIKYALLLSWNYKNFFLKKSKFIKNGGKFIIPF